MAHSTPEVPDVQPNDGNASQRLEFGYDGQSRRVVKRVLQKVSETSSWSLRQERRFLYDG